MKYLVKHVYLFHTNYNPIIINLMIKLNEVNASLIWNHHVLRFCIQKITSNSFELSRLLSAKNYSVTKIQFSKNSGQTQTGTPKKRNNDNQSQVSTKANSIGRSEGKQKFHASAPPQSCEIKPICSVFVVFEGVYFGISQSCTHMFSMFISMLLNE